MKKFVFPFCFILLFSVFFSACDNSQQNPSEEYVSDWVEVQSITYYKGENYVRKTSSYTLYYKIEETTQSEYDSAPEELREITNYHQSSQVTEQFSKKRKDTLADIKQKHNIYHYYALYDINTAGELYVSSYWKYKITEYEIDYVQIRFLTEGRLEINFDDNHLVVLPSAYEITYFAD